MRPAEPPEGDPLAAARGVVLGTVAGSLVWIAAAVMVASLV